MSYQMSYGESGSLWVTDDPDGVHIGVHAFGGLSMSMRLTDEFEDKLFTILARRKYARQEPLTITCPKCNGTREVMVRYADSTADTPFTACPNCLDGTIALPDPIEPMDEAA